MKTIITILTLIMFIGLASAVPQVIFSELNISIWSNQSTSGNVTTTTGNYRILGEGLNAQTTFVVNGNCSFSYDRTNIPLTFSREVAQNDTDLSILIHELTINRNITADYIRCRDNLSVCMNDAGYKGNYTNAIKDLDICYRARDDFSKQVIEKKDEIANLTTWRNIGMAFGIIGIVVAGWLYNKNRLKVANNPYSGVSGVAKQYS